jgi:hypothetical protein
MAVYKSNGFNQTAVNLKRLQARNRELLKLISGGLPRTMMNAGQIIEARAKEILTEKGHVVTGNLRRSINTQLIDATERRVVVAVGSFVEYAPFVERLPDGGFLFPASVETLPQTIRFVYDNGIKKPELNWGRA